MDKQMEPRMEQGNMINKSKRTEGKWQGKKKYIFFVFGYRIPVGYKKWSLAGGHCGSPSISDGYPILKIGDETRRVFSFIENETQRVSVCYMGNERLDYLLPGSLEGQNMLCDISAYEKELVPWVV